MTPKKRADKAQILFPTGLPVSKPVRYDAGETIFTQGDECTDVGYIEEGIVKLMLVSNRGRRGILGFLGRGDFFWRELSERPGILFCVGSSVGARVNHSD